MNTSNSGYYAEPNRQRAGASDLFEEVKTGFLAVFLVSYVEPAGCAVVHSTDGAVRRKTEALS
jgi:hypothetical protein